jgi:dipeptidyl aminopeptidase/acylaminoacyl peptidase
MFRVLPAAAACVLFLFTPTKAQQPSGRALTIEDYYRIQAVGNPSLSPAGAWVVFTLTTRLEEPDGNSNRVEVWVARSDASTQPQRVLHQDKDVTNPGWTDEGYLQYTVDSQRWKIDPASLASTAIKVESSTGRDGGRGGRGGGSWPSPDGKWEAAAVNKPNPSKGPVYVSEFEKRHQERFKGVTFDWKDFQRDGADFPAPDPAAQPGQQIVLRPRGENSLPEIGIDVDLRPAGLAWHPSGQLLAFAADPDWRNALKYNSPDLWTVSRDGKITRLTNDGYVYGNVGYSPDGRFLSYSRSFGTDMIIEQRLNHGGPQDLYVRPAAGGEPINLTAAWDLDPGPARWSPDSRYLYFSAGIGGEHHLFRVSVPGAKVEQITKGARRLNGIAFDRSLTKIAYTVGAHDAPADVYVANIDGSNERQLTNVHKTVLAEIALGKAERLRWSSDDGTSIEGWLMFPYGYDPGKGPYL